jgi:transposase-like protein
MRPQGSPELLEERRRSVAAFLKQKLSLHEIARRIGCHASSVLRWRDALQSGGRTESQAGTRPATPTDLETEKTARSSPDPRGHGSWISERVVDHPTNCRSGRTSIGSEISSQSRRQTPARDRLEPPETGTSGRRAR